MSAPGPKKTAGTEHDTPKKAPEVTSDAGFQAQMEPLGALGQFAGVGLLQRKMAVPGTVTLRSMPAMQRAYGNRLIQAVLKGDGGPAAGQPAVQEKEAQATGAPGEAGGELPDDLSAEIQQEAGKGGAPLPEEMQSRVQSDLGVKDPDQIQVHTDAQADELSRSLGARAFTTGNDIFFREGEYNPGSEEGQHLLLHESVHTVQQGGVSGSTTQRMAVNPAGDRYEQEADQIAGQAVQRASAGTPGPRVQRAESDEDEEYQEEKKQPSPEEIGDMPNKVKQDKLDQSVDQEGKTAEKSGGKPQEKDDKLADEAKPDLPEGATMGAPEGQSEEQAEKEREESEEGEEGEEDEGATPEEKEKAKRDSQSSSQSKSDKEEAKSRGKGEEEGEEQKKEKESKKKQGEKPQAAAKPAPPPSPEVAGLTAAAQQIDGDRATELKYEPAEMEFKEPPAQPRLPTWDELASGTIQLSISDVENEYRVRQGLGVENPTGITALESGEDITVAEEAEGESEPVDAKKMAGEALKNGVLTGLQEGAMSFATDLVVETATSKIPYADGMINMIRLVSDPGAWVQDNIFAIGDTAVAAFEGFKAIANEDTVFGYVAATLEAILGVIDFINSIINLINQIFTIILFIAKALLIFSNIMIALAPIFVPFFFPFAWTPAVFGPIASIMGTIISFLHPVNDVLSLIGTIIEGVKLGIQALAIIFRFLDMMTTKEGDPDKLAEKQSKLQDNVTGLTTTAVMKTAGGMKDKAQEGISNRVAKGQAKREIADLESQVSKRGDDPELKAQLEGKKAKFQDQFQESYDTVKNRSMLDSAKKLGKDMAVGTKDSLVGTGKHMLFGYGDVSEARAKYRELHPEANAQAGPKKNILSRMATATKEVVVGKYEDSARTIKQELAADQQFWKKGAEKLGKKTGLTDEQQARQQRLQGDVDTSVAGTIRKSENQREQDEAQQKRTKDDQIQEKLDKKLEKIDTDIGAKEHQADNSEDLAHGSRQLANDKERSADDYSSRAEGRESFIREAEAEQLRLNQESSTLLSSASRLEEYNKRNVSEKQAEVESIVKRRSDMSDEEYQKAYDSRVKDLDEAKRQQTEDLKKVKQYRDEADDLNAQAIQKKIEAEEADEIRKALRRDEQTAREQATRERADADKFEQEARQLRDQAEQLRQDRAFEERKAHYQKQDWGEGYDRKALTWAGKILSKPSYGGQLHAAGSMEGWLTTTIRGMDWYQEYIQSWQTDPTDAENLATAQATVAAGRELYDQGQYDQAWELVGELDANEWFGAADELMGGASGWEQGDGGVKSQDKIDAANEYKQLGNDITNLQLDLKAQLGTSLMDIDRRMQVSISTLVPDLPGGARKREPEATTFVITMQGTRVGDTEGETIDLKIGGQTEQTLTEFPTGEGEIVKRYQVAENIIPSAIKLSPKSVKLEYEENNQTQAYEYTPIAQKVESEGGRYKAWVGYERGQSLNTAPGGNGDNVVENKQKVLAGEPLIQRMPADEEKPVASGVAGSSGTAQTPAPTQPASLTGATAAPIRSAATPKPQTLTPPSPQTTSSVPAATAPEPTPTAETPYPAAEQPGAGEESAETEQTAEQTAQERAQDAMFAANLEAQLYGQPGAGAEGSSAEGGAEGGEGDYFTALLASHQSRLIEVLPDPPPDMISRVQGAALAYAQVDAESYDLQLQQQQIGAMQQHGEGQAAELQGARTLTAINQKGIEAHQGDAKKQEEAQKEKQKSLSSSEEQGQETAEGGGEGGNFFSKIFGKILQGFGMGAAMGGGNADAGGANTGTQETAATSQATASSIGSGEKLTSAGQAKNQAVQMGAAKSHEQVSSLDEHLAGKEESNQEGMSELSQAGEMNQQGIDTTESEKQRLRDDHQAAVNEADAWAGEHRMVRESVFAELEADLAAPPEEQLSRLESRK